MGLLLHEATDRLAVSRSHPLAASVSQTRPEPPSGPQLCAAGLQDRQGAVSEATLSWSAFFSSSFGSFGCYVTTFFIPEELYKHPGSLIPR